MSLITISKELQDAQLSICEPKGEPSNRFQQDFHTCFVAWRLEVDRREEEKSEFKAGKNHSSTCIATEIDVC